MLKTLQKEKFFNCRWLIYHTFFILVILFRKPVVDIGIILSILAFQQRSCRKPLEKEKRILTCCFSVAVIRHNIHCFGRKKFSKDASSWVFLNLSKNCLTLRFIYLKAGFLLVSMQQAPCDLPLKINTIFKIMFCCTAIFKDHQWSPLLSLFLSFYIE